MNMITTYRQLLKFTFLPFLVNSLRCQYRSILSMSTLGKKESILFSQQQQQQQVDTIYALSTGSVMKAGVAVIRVSGPSSKFCLESLLQNQPFPKPRVASLRWLVNPQSNENLDKGLVLWFPGPRSFTGEDCMELHIHSGRAVITGVLSALGQLDNMKKGALIRPAERGEFTQRAYYNGKMDLTEVEGLADLLAADTSEQRKQALKQMDGKLSALYENWREELLGCLAHTEAVIDFGDDDREDDIDDSVMWTITPRVRELRDQLSRHLQDGRRGEIIREGIQIALVGPPNAGKSSLLNLLARRPASIVSPVAGTTRDIVEVRMDLGGVPCIIRDTAGVRAEESADEIEREGMRRAREAMKQAQIRVLVSDASDPSSVRDATRMLTDALSFNTTPISASESLVEDESADISQSITPTKMFFIRNKIDNLDTKVSDSSSKGANKQEEEDLNSDVQQFDVSCVTGDGISSFESALTQAALSLLQPSDTADGADTTESAVITRDRHRSHVKRCVRHLDEFIDAGLPMDAAAEELRLAMMELGRITGRVDVEELLDVIFRDFCIGK